jgi:hypothetical protein
MKRAYQPSISDFFGKVQRNEVPKEYLPRPGGKVEFVEEIRTTGAVTVERRTMVHHPGALAEARRGGRRL